MGWLAALGAVIGLGVLGGRVSQPQEDRAVVAVTPAATMTIPWAMALRRSTLVELVVRGRVARDAGPVVIRLETVGGSTIATEPVDPTGHGHGDWVPFETRFHVSRPGPGHESGWFIVAVDAAGARLGAGPQPYSGSLFLDVTQEGARPIAQAGGPRRSASPGQHPIGNDGLIGGIVFGVPIAGR